MNKDESLGCEGPAHIDVRKINPRYAPTADFVQAVADLSDAMGSPAVRGTIGDTLTPVIKLAADRFRGMRQQPAPAVPACHVGDSRFEGWFNEYDMANKGTKQQMRDAYAAGMSDEIPAEFDVRKIMLDIVPGDGNGLEVFAKSVDDVVRKLTELSEREDSLRTQVDLLTAAVEARGKRIAQLESAPAVPAALPSDMTDLADIAEVWACNPRLREFAATMQPKPVAPAVPAKLPQGFATSRNGDDWRVTLIFKNGDDAKALAGYMDLQGVPATNALVPAVPAGWLPIETAPTMGIVILLVEHEGEQRSMVAEASSEEGVGWQWMTTHGWTGWSRLHKAWTPISWQPLPPALQATKGQP